MCQRYEEENISLNENLRIMNERLEELGENRSNFIENLKNEKNNHS